MIYGYDEKTLNDYGLRQMKEISIQGSPDDLRELAGFLAESAEQLENASSSNWHRHVPESLQRKIGCDLIVLSNR